MSHTASGRRGLASDESNHRLLHVLFDIRRRGLFGVSANFADHDNGMGIGILVKQADGTIRKLYAESIERNSIHGSDAPETAAVELAYFFRTVDLAK